MFRIAECHVPEKRKLEAVFIENAVVSIMNLEEKKKKKKEKQVLLFSYLSGQLECSIGEGQEYCSIHGDLGKIIRRGHNQ